MSTLDEPIPDFDTRYPGVLESCLDQPFASFGGIEQYSTFIEKAAILFYLMNKNHPFANGNKRIAVATLMWFLVVHDLGLSTTPKELYEFAVGVADSKSGEYEKVGKDIQTFIREKLVPYEEWADAILRMRDDTL